MTAQELAREPVARAPFLKVAWTSGALSVVPMMMMYICGFTVLAPYLPDLMTNFFAEQASGIPIHCENFSSHDTELPKECITGSADSVMWSSYSQFFSNAIVAFMLYPITGVWSDMFGRKPFLLLSQALGLLPKLIVLLHVLFDMSLYSYYPVLMLTDVVSLMSAALATVSDCLPPEHRAAGFAVTLGSLSAGLAVAPLFGQVLGLRGAVAAALGFRGLGLLYTMVFIKETVPPEMQAAARYEASQFWQQRSAQQISPQGDLFMRACHATCRCVGNQPSIRTMFQGFFIVLRNSEFMRLTAAQMCSAFISVGVMQVENQVLLVLFGFKQHEFALVFAIAGSGMFLAQVVLMPLLLLVVRERALIAIAYSALVVKFAGLVVAQTHGQVLLAIAFGSLTFMAYPSISSIKATGVPDHEQGAVQGALSGATALASGVGPLVFNQLYSWATTTVFLPRAVPAVCAVLALVPLGLVCWLDLDKLRRWKLQQEEAQQQRGRSVDEPLLAEGQQTAQLKPSQLTAPHGDVPKDGNCLDSTELRTEGSSSTLDT